jgi:hypothetical protein
MKISNVSDLQSLIDNQIEENLHLDYKAAGALHKTDGKKKIEISKDVSAFANSDGGVIVYGIKEFNDPTKKYLPESIDPIDRNEISKEWLEQVINSNISPKIEGIEIIPISIDITLNKVVYIVRIPKSNTAHQAKDNRYYKRYNFESIAMQDYEVRDIMNRKKLPKIELSFKIEQFIYEEHSIFPVISTIQIPQSLSQPKKPQRNYVTRNSLLVSAHNTGGSYANYVNSFVEIPASLLDEQEYDHMDTYTIKGIEYKQIFCDNKVREFKEMVMNTCKYWPSRYEPILPEICTRLETITLNQNIDNIERLTGIIYWSIYADNAEKLEGQINIADIEKHSKSALEESIENQLTK